MSSLPLGTLVDAAGAAVLAGLGVWVLTLEPRSRRTLLLAGFALLMGTGYILRNLADVFAAAFDPLVVGSGAFLLAAAAALVGLGARLPRRLETKERRLALFAGLLPGILALAGLGRFISEDGIGDPDWVFQWGEFLLLAGFLFPLLLLPLRAHRWAADPEQALMHRQAALVAGALVLFAGVRAGMFSIAAPGPTALGLGVWVLALSSLLVPFLLIAGLWLRAAAAGGPGAVRARNVAWVTLAAVLTGMALAVALVNVFTSGASGVIRTLTVLVLSYAILRHRLLGLDAKVRWSVSRTTVAGAFLAVFFVVSEGAQLLFAGFAGSELLGILAAGALLFGLAPIQRMADRIAERAVPDAGQSPEATGAQRYRTAVETALADGVITREEERYLAELAEELGLSHPQVREIREGVRAQGAGERDEHGTEVDPST